MFKFIIIAITIYISTMMASFAGNITGTVSTADVGNSQNVVVYLIDVPGEFLPPEINPVVNQKLVKFIPHVLPVVAGTTVDFLNSDVTPHNVFTPDKSFDRFNLGTWSKGEKRSYTFEAECEEICSPVMLCSLHPEMEAYIVVLKNPYFAVTDEKGNFVIKDVPVGEYEIGMWHKKLKGKGGAVIVSGAESVSVELQMKN